MNQLISSIARLIKKEERKDFIIFGSSAIVLNGIDLGREVQDLDMFVSKETYKNLKGRFTEKTKPSSYGIVSFYEPAENIEIWDWFPGVTFEQMTQRASAKDNSAEFPVAHIDDVIIWKSSQGREKDLKDLQKIKEHINTFCSL